MGSTHNKLKIGLIGYGKMGKSIEKFALQAGHEIYLRISSTNLLELNSENLNKLDVAIEFTQPDAALNNLKILGECGTPTICGTTGWLDRYEEVTQLFTDNKAAFMYASNFSIGVNLFFEINKYAAKLMDTFNNYEVSIEEIHHTEKKDAPSGTGITLAEQIIGANDSKESWINSTPELQSQLEIISKREPEVKGTHTVTYKSKIDNISLEHAAHSREGFARGALMAAEWIAKKQGIFTFRDMMQEMNTNGQ